jgi:putative ABC transport system permease protein
MIRNYFLIAWRSLLKNKLFSVINIFGLALSMSIGVLVLIIMSDAFSYDGFHPDGKNIYRIISNITDKQGRSWRMASSPLPLGGTISKEVPTTLIYPAIHSTMKDTSREFDCKGAFIQPSFFDIFGFRLQSGNPASLNNPQQLVLSQEFSRKFFGDVDPLGRIVTIDKFGEFEIAGVMADPPAKSHIQYDVFISMSTVAPAKLQDWNTLEAGYTYVKVSNDSEKDALIHDIERQAKDINAMSVDSKIEFELQSLSSITPSGPDIYNDIGRSPSLGSLLASMTIALVILVAACFNYTNLSVARALTRGKEIGVRKLSGATRFQIIAQYVTEALLISVMALLVANFILAPILEYEPFNDGYEMIPDLQFSWRLVWFIAAYTVLTATLAGGLPAWLLSSLKPVRILRGIATEKLIGHLSLRKTLLVFQFSLSMIVLVFLSTFYSQFDFLANADLGFNRKNVLLVPKGLNGDVTAASLNEIAGVELTGFTSGKFGNNMNITASRAIGEADPAPLDYYACDEGWMQIMGLKVVAGSLVGRNESNVVVNEKAASVLGFKNSSEAVGSRIYLQDSVAATIRGVVSDFYSNGYGNPVRPIVFRNDSRLFKLIAIKTGGMNSSLVHDVEKEWRKQNPEHSFDHTWLDEEMHEHDSQTATVSLLGFLGLITISIASLGLLGLVVYTVEVRRKEISIRKIVGATVQQLAALLSKGFLSLLCIAGVIALPLGYLMSELFLMNFVNHISISWWQLADCFALLLAIGLIAILPQTVDAANENPARNLRSE